MGEDYGSKLSDLKGRRAKNLAMGGEERIARQHQRGKLTVRERIDLLFDPGTFVEIGLLASQQAVRRMKSRSMSSPLGSKSPA